MKKEQLEKLVNSDDYQKRIIAAKDTEIFKYPDLLQILLHDTHKYVTRALALNKDLFKHLKVAKKLLNDVNFVSKEIVKRKDLFTKGKNLIPYILRHKNIKLRINLALRPDLFQYPEIANKLVDDTEEVYFELAKHKDLYKYPFIVNKLLKKYSKIIKKRQEQTTMKDTLIAIGKICLNIIDHNELENFANSQISQVFNLEVYEWSYKNKNYIMGTMKDLKKYTLEYIKDYIIPKLNFLCKNEKKLAKTLLDIYGIEANLGVKQLGLGDIDNFYVYVKN